MVVQGEVSEFSLSNLKDSILSQSYLSTRERVTNTKLCAKLSFFFFFWSHFSPSKQIYHWRHVKVRLFSSLNVNNKHRKKLLISLLDSFTLVR